MKWKNKHFIMWSIKSDNLKKKIILPFKTKISKITKENYLSNEIFTEI